MTIFHTAAFRAQPILHGRASAELAARSIRKRSGETRTPACALVLGSGLASVGERIEDAVRIPFADIPGFPDATVPGHAGQLIMGTLEKRPVVALSGRLHVYEGHDPAHVAFPVRVLHALGAPMYFASNAAGALRRTLRRGDLMIVADHINLQFSNPLLGPRESSDERFPDMSDPYDPELRQLLKVSASEAGVAVQEGVYCGVAGPSYETPAEVRFLERFGADVVGMSTVPEVIVARALGMRVAAVSCITNYAAGLTQEPMEHSEVLETARAVAADFESLVRAFLRRLPDPTH